MKIRILIPVYRPIPTDEERRAIANNVRQLSAYDVAFVAPEGLDMAPYAALAPAAETVRVGEEWLGSRNGIAGYNAMMLSERFYRLFEAWDYILICHPDAWIFRDEVAKAGFDRQMNQYFAVLTSMRSVGVMGDGRTYDYTLALRGVTTSDFMTADWARIPYDVLDRVSVRIVNEVRGINRIVSDITSKPPATIEWE